MCAWRWPAGAGTLSTNWPRPASSMASSTRGTAWPLPNRIAWSWGWVMVLMRCEGVGAFASQSMGSITVRKTEWRGGERGVEPAREGDDLEQLAHLVLGEQFLRVGDRRHVGALQVVEDAAVDQ